MLKADGSLLVHSDGGSYKPLNWMSPPCTVAIDEPDELQQAAGIREVWRVTQAKTADMLVVSIHEILSDTSHDLGIDPGLQKDGVEAHLQKLLAEQIHLLGDPHVAPVTGIFAAQEIKPQARTLAEDRGIRCLVLDYDAMRGLDDSESRLF